MVVMTTNDNTPFFKEKLTGRQRSATLNDAHLFLSQAFKRNYPSMKFTDIQMERTLAIIKPDAFSRADEIKSIILTEGFQITQELTTTLTEHQVRALYAEHEEKPFFANLIQYMTSGPVVIAVLNAENAIEKWRQLIGPPNVIEAAAQQPDSIRAKFGTSEFQNAVHGSSTFVTAEQEIEIFFPEVASEPTATGLAAKAYLAESVNPTLLRGLTELCKLKPPDPIVWLADWLLVNNPTSQARSKSTSDEEQDTSQ